MQIKVASERIARPTPPAVIHTCVSYCTL